MPKGNTRTAFPRVTPSQTPPSKIPFLNPPLNTLTQQEKPNKKNHRDYGVEND